MALEGEAYVAETFFRERYRQLKKAKTPGLKKSWIMAANEGGTLMKIWIIECEVEAPQAQEKLWTSN